MQVYNEWSIIWLILTRGWTRLKDCIFQSKIKIQQVVNEGGCAPPAGKKEWARVNLGNDCLTFSPIGSSFEITSSSSFLFISCYIRAHNTQCQTNLFFIGTTEKKNIETVSLAKSGNPTKSKKIRKLELIGEKNLYESHLCACTYFCGR